MKWNHYEALFYVKFVIVPLYWALQIYFFKSTQQYTHTKKSIL